MELDTISRLEEEKERMLTCARSVDWQVVWGTIEIVIRDSKVMFVSVKRDYKGD